MDFNSDCNIEGCEREAVDNSGLCKRHKTELGSEGGTVAANTPTEQSQILALRTQLAAQQAVIEKKDETLRKGIYSAESWGEYDLLVHLKSALALQPSTDALAEHMKPALDALRWIHEQFCHQSDGRALDLTGRIDAALAHYQPKESAAPQTHLPQAADGNTVTIHTDTERLKAALRKLGSIKTESLRDSSFYHSAAQIEGCITILREVINGESKQP